MKQIPEAFEDDSPRKKTQDQMNSSAINVHEPENNNNENAKQLQNEEEFYFNKVVSKQEINLPEDKTQDMG